MSTNRTDIYQIVTDKIITALEAGTPPWVRPWQGAIDPLPINAESKQVYRGVNFITLQIEAQVHGYERNLWMTYRQAITRGAQVRNGARGTPVVFWKLRKFDGKADGPAERKELTIPLVRYSTAFNVAQIDGLPAGLADRPSGAPLWSAVRDAEAVIAASGADIRHGGLRAFYQPSNDYVQLPPTAYFDSAGGYYATALHELSHWTSHKSRLDRKLEGRFGDAAYAMEELIAEMGSAFLCAHTRIDGVLQHASYLETWLKVLRADKRAIFVACTRAQNAADYLLDRVADKQAESIAACSATGASLEAEAA